MEKIAKQKEDTLWGIAFVYRPLGIVKNNNEQIFIDVLPAVANKPFKDDMDFIFCQYSLSFGSFKMDKYATSGKILH